MNTETNQTSASIKNDFFLCLEGALAGIAAGIASAFYRYSLTYAEQGLYKILDFIKGNALYTALWLLVLALIGVLVTRIVKWESFSGGSGVPQVMAEVRGKIEAPWWRTLIGKFVSGTLCIFGGLSLGRTGPSVQLGAMAAKGYARFRKSDKEQEILLLSFGAAAGISATFNAPFAGLFFMLEEIQGKSDRKLLLGGLSACASASVVSQCFFGSGPVFHYDLQTIPYTYAWLLIPFGILMGLFGAFYNFCLLKTAGVFKSLGRLPKELVNACVFLVSGIVGLLIPEILAGGKTMSGILETKTPVLSTIVVLLIAKYLFTIFSAGSGVPGGLFFPLLVLGSFSGALCGLWIIRLFALPEAWLVQFILLGMAGLFAAAIRTPLTAIFLTVELCQIPGLFFPLVIVTAIACVTANMTGSRPICQTLMHNLLKANGQSVEE